MIHAALTGATVGGRHGGGVELIGRYPLAGRRIQAAARGTRGRARSVRPSA